MIKLLIPVVATIAGIFLIQLDTSNYRRDSASQRRCSVLTTVRAIDLVDFLLQEAPVGVPGGDFAVMRAHLVPDARQNA